MNFPQQPQQPHPQMQPGMHMQQQQMQQQMLAQQQPHPQQQQQQQQQRQQDHREKAINRARELVGPLREKWAATVREAANKVSFAREFEA